MALSLTRHFQRLVGAGRDLHHYASYNQSTMLKSLDAAEKCRLSDSQSPFTSAARASSARIGESIFFTLPPELRLEVYDLLLVGHYQSYNSVFPVQERSQNVVALHIAPVPRHRTMEPAILRTCRRIYAEAAPRLYAMNVFAINAPDQLVSLFDQVDLAHFHLIRSLDIFVPCWTPVEPWIPMFSLLSQHAAGLRSIVIKWNSDIDYVQKHERGCRGSGLGDDVSFVRALASVRGLDKLVIKGFFATHWPAYLSASIGIQVQDLPGNCYEPPENATSWICEIADNINEQGLLDFVEYQKGTEGLWP